MASHKECNREICSGLPTTIIATAIQKSIQRKQRTTIITHANIKKQVDSQLKPYMKKDCTWVCSSVPDTVKVLLKLMLCKFSSYFTLSPDLKKKNR